MSEQLRVEPAVHQRRKPESGVPKSRQDDLETRMRETVGLWQAAAREETATRTINEQIDTTVVAETQRAVAEETVSTVRRVQEGVSSGLQTIREVAVYAVNHPKEVGLKVTKEVGWIGVGVAVKSAVVATGAAVGGAVVTVAAVGVGMAAGSVNAMRDLVMLNREADAHELKIGREAKKLKNARELYKKYTHVDAKNLAQKNDESREKGWLGKIYQKVMVDGLTRYGVEAAYEVRDLRDQVDVLDARLADREIVGQMSEQELLNALEVASDFVYKAQDVAERRKAQAVVRSTYELLMDKADRGNKDVRMYKDVIAQLMKERQAKFEEQSRKAVMMAGLGKGVDAVWKFASGAMIVSAGRNLGEAWQNMFVQDVNSDVAVPRADVVRGVYEVPRGSGGSTKVLAMLYSPDVVEAGNLVGVRDVSGQAITNIADANVVEYAAAPPDVIDVKPGQGLFAAMRDSGMSVTDEGSARAFLERIAPLAVFRLSGEKLRMLMDIVAKNPHISADQLRTLARAKGIDFDREFAVDVGEIQVPQLIPREIVEEVVVEAPSGEVILTRNGSKVLVSPVTDLYFQQGQPPEPPLPPVEPNPYVVRVNPTRIVGADNPTAASISRTAPVTVVQSGVVNSSEGSPVIRVNPTRIVGADNQTLASVSRTVPVTVVQSGVVNNSERSPYVLRAAEVSVVGAENVVPSAAVTSVRTEVVQPTNVSAPAVIRAPRVVGYDSGTTVVTRAAESVVVAPSVAESVVVPVVLEPAVVEAPRQQFLWNGFDVSPENAVNLKFGNATVMMDGKAYNLFNFLPEWTRQRVYNQEFSVDMNGFFDGDTYAYDPVKRNMFIFVHSWRTDGKELPAEWLRRMIEGGYDIPPYAGAQIESRMQEIVNQNVVLQGEMFGRTVPLRLTDIQRISHAETMSLSSQELFNYDGVEEGKIYIVFCSGSHSDALEMFSRPDIQALPGFPRNAFSVLTNPGARGDEYAGALRGLSGWLQNASPDKYNEFFRLFDRKAGGEDFSAENMGYARYIVELTPSGQ